MPTYEHPRDLVRFGEFELDPATGELTCDGSTIRLQPQPLKVLLALVRQRGKLVTRQELKQELMPDSPFGDADHAINLAVTKLRTALQDSSEKPRFIDTLPRRGYRFVAELEARDADDLSYSPRPKQRVRIIGAVLACIAVMAILFFEIYSWQPREKRTVVLAALVNDTGDPGLETTLRQSLSAGLQHSSSLKLLSDQRISGVLPLMMQPSDARLSTHVALEVCQRTASSAVIDGSCAMLGNQYVVELRAVNCRTGDLLADEQLTTGRRDELLSTVRDAANKLREQLERLLPSLPESPPLEYVTTHSVEALRAYTLGSQATLGARDDLGAIPLFERAIDLDPYFAMAHAQLGALHSSIGQSARAAEMIGRAYGLRQAVSGREKLFIEAHYEHMVTGNLGAARKHYELWTQLYPHETIPLIRLASIHRSLNECRTALALLQRALKMSPNEGAIHSGIVDAGLCLGSLEEVESAAQEASNHNVDTPEIHVSMYLAAFLQHDTARMEKESAYLSTLPEWSAVILCSQASTAAYSGQLQQARSLVRRSVAVALLADQPEVAGNCHADAALWEALFGNSNEAFQEAHAAVVLADSSNIGAKSAIALAVSGDSKGAANLADRLAERFPMDTKVQQCYLPAIRGTIALAKGRTAEALDILAPISVHDDGSLVAIYVRGLAYVAAGQNAAAGAEFRRIIDLPGILPNGPLRALSQLHLARALAKTDETSNARTAYETLLTSWDDADTDIPLVKQVEDEYQQITQATK